VAQQTAGPAKRHLLLLLLLLASALVLLVPACCAIALLLGQAPARSRSRREAAAQMYQRNVILCAVNSIGFDVDEQHDGLH
jgi:flagellar basal body-associated protein FliL